MTSTIGEQLKQARLKRGLTLVQASQSTHIRTNYLEALENDQRDALPSKVQGRGFLRLYAGLLDLPVEPLLAAWDGKPPVEAPLNPAGEQVPTRPAVGASAAADQPVAGEPPPSDDSLSAKKQLSDKLPTVKPRKKKKQDGGEGIPAEKLSGDLETAANSTAASPAEFPLPEGEELEPALPPIKDPAVVEEAPPIPIPPPVQPPEPEPTGSRLIFKEVGGKLRQQREALGLSLVEVERYTRLRIHYIQALEDGRIDDLPSPVQGRGMLSNYAEFLNMDEDALLLRFAEGLQVRRVERLPRPDPHAAIAGKRQKRPAQQAPIWRRFLTPDLLFGFGMAAIILFFVLWSSARYFSSSTQPAQPTPPGVSAMLLTQVSLGTGTPTGQAGAATAGAATGIAGEQATSAAPLEPGSETPPTVEGTPAAGETPLAEISGTPAALPQVVQEGTVTPPSPPSGKDPLQVYIVARQRAFLKITVDDKVKFLGRVVPGNAYTFSGSKRVELLTGNAAALQVFYNQQDLGVLGNPGQVVGLVFLPAGMATPTAAFTPTQTPVKATATPTQKPSPMATPSITPFVP